MKTILILAALCAGVVNVNAAGLDSLIGKTIWYVRDGQVFHTARISQICVSGRKDATVAYTVCIQDTVCHDESLVLSGTKVHCNMGWSVAMYEEKRAFLWATTQEGILELQRTMAQKSLDSLKAQELEQISKSAAKGAKK